MSHVFKYRMLVQTRTDLTKEEQQYVTRNSGPHNHYAPNYPFRDTGEVIHARRRKQACAFYRALRHIKPIIKIRAVRINDRKQHVRGDDVAMRAWRGFKCIAGSLQMFALDIEDEVKHFEVGPGQSACGITFTSSWAVNGKPECEKCLAVAVNCHPEMRQYL